MPHLAALPTSLRRTLLLRVGGLVVASAMLVSAIFVVLGLGPMTGRVAETQFDAAATRVEASLTALFAPTENLVRMSRSWADARLPEAGGADAFNRQFRPLVQNLPQVTSVVAGTSAGEGWMLLQQPGGRWSSRVSDAGRWGRRHLLVEYLPDGEGASQWKELDYDVRDRPWFQGALAAPAAIHWTAPYTLYTTGDPGITVSATRRLEDGRDLVVGLDVMLRDLSRTTMQAALGRFGRALVIGDDERVLALPAPPAGVGDDAWLARLLQPAGELGLEEVADALARWRSAGRQQTGVIAYRSGGHDWLARIQPYPLGNQRFWVLAVAPAAEFAPDWTPVLFGIGGAVALVLASALFLLRFEALRIAAPLESLAAASRGLAGPTAPAPAPVRAGGIAEVEQLASAQAAMADRLQRDQELLADQDERLRRQLQALQESEAKFRLLFETANDGIFLLDRTGYIDCNERGLGLYGLSRNQLRGRTPAELAPERQPDGRPSTLVARERALAALAGQPQFFEWQLRCADGALRDVEITLSRLPLAGGDGLQAIMRDITRRKQAEDEIRQLAYFDPLTGLPNRRLLLDRLGHALIASERSREFGALIMLDLDHFKLLNDTQGHDAGDRLLVQVAERVQACVRREDTVARLGGDEYLVMLEALGQDEQTAAHQTEIVAEKIRAGLNEPYRLGDGRDFHSTGSLGLTLFGHLPGSPEAVLKQADLALYRAKDAGRNAIRFYNPDMQAAIDERVRLEAGLRQALARGEFCLHYQPQVTGGDSRRIVAVEALIRWQHPTDGLVPPGRFIPLAEHTGQILAMGTWVIREACRQLAAWKAEGLRVQRVAVNLSARQLHAPRLVEDIQAALDDHGLAGGELELEVTESTAMEDPERAIGLLGSLRALGVKLAIDDFGTGYSSLSQLRRLPIQTLKLDRSFVGDIESDDGDAAICAATLSLARNLGLQVVAEGVETEAQLYFLSTVHGCDLLQGYLFGHPVPAADLAQLLRAQAGRTA